MQAGMLGNNGCARGRVQAGAGVQVGAFCFCRALIAGYWCRGACKCLEGKRARGAIVIIGGISSLEKFSSISSDGLLEFID